MGSDKVIGLGLAGAGTVGGGVVKALREKEQFFRKDLGLPVKLARIVDADASRFAALPTGDAICSGDLADILGDQGIGIVIELIGGTTTAKDFYLSALARGKHVVTANKALLALHGPEIFEAAERNDVSVYFEASVGGGMPVIKTIRESLVGNDASSVKTIINGTCNYILSRMTASGLPFADALKEAQAKGYAEANPALDVGGGDSGHKVAIIASLLHSGYLPFSAVSVEGISGLTPEDIEYADELGYVIKLLGIVEREGADAPIEARVHPAMLRREHILASVSDAFNAVLLYGNNVGDILLYGKGAGELPTASAVMSDIADVARNILGGTPRRLPMGYYRESKRLPVKPLAEHVSRYYLRFSVVDKPGVLAAIASIFGKHSISISSVMQREAVEGQSVPVIFLTHEAIEASLRSALAEIAAMDFNLASTQVIRMEG